MPNNICTRDDGHPFLMLGLWVFFSKLHLICVLNKADRHGYAGAVHPRKSHSSSVPQSHHGQRSDLATVSVPVSSSAWLSGDCWPGHTSVVSSGSDHPHPEVSIETRHESGQCEDPGVSPGKSSGRPRTGGMNESAQREVEMTQLWVTVSLCLD